MNSDSERSQSYWVSARLPQFRALDADLKTEFLVIGGGVAGLSVAYELARAGHEAALVDRGRLGGGMTSRTSAHLSWEIDDFYHEVVSAHGNELAKQYYESQKAALDRIETIATEENIDCDFARIDLHYIASGLLGRRKIDREQTALKDLGIGTFAIKEAPLNKPIEGLHIPQQARFHVLKYLYGLARAFERLGGKIYDNTAVKSVSENAKHVRAKTENGHTITAKAIVAATGTPFVNREAVHDRQAPYRSYVIAGPVPKGSVPDILLWDTEDPYHYVRLQPGPTEDLLIVGGEDHKTGEANDADTRLDRLAKWARGIFPQFKRVTYAWSGQLFEPTDYLPLIGRSPDHKNVYVVTGDSGEGLTTGVAASLILPDLMTEKENKWSAAYDVNRKTSKPSTVVTYAKDFVGALAHVAEHVVPTVRDAEELHPEQGGIFSEGGEKIAAYRDRDGELHKRSASCTHAGCVVQWNGFERCWDCPCHGSHFAIDGEVLNAPAVDPLKPAGERKAKKQSGSMEKASG